MTVAQTRRLPRLFLAVAVFALATFAPASHAAQEEEFRIGDIDAVVWTPEAKAAVPLPVVVFSHGLYTCATQSRFLTQALADSGYLVIAPNHRDASCGFSFRWPGMSRLPGKPAALWSDEDFRDRADDIRSLVRALTDDARFRGIADVARIALAGHSLGGYTVLGLAGAWPKWTLPGVKAVLALAPYALPFEHSAGLKHLRVPVMYQTGEFDPIFTRPLRGAFEQFPEPKYYVEIENAWHLTWADIGMLHPPTIVAYAVAFFDRYLKGASESRLLDGDGVRAASAKQTETRGPDWAAAPRL